MFRTSWIRPSFVLGFIPLLLLAGFVPAFSFQEVGPQFSWKVAATQNQFLQDYFYDEYWLARREAEPEAIRDLSSREPYERQYPKNEVPGLERMGRSRSQRPEGRTRHAEKYVEKEILKLVQKVDRHLAAISDSFGAARAAAGNPGQRKELRNSLKKVAEKSSNLRFILLPVYTTLSAQDALNGRPARDGSKINLMEELEKLGRDVKRAQTQVQDTVAGGSSVVGAAEYSQNMLLTLYHVEYAADRLSKTL